MKAFPSSFPSYSYGGVDENKKELDEDENQEYNAEFSIAGAGSLSKEDINHTYESSTGNLHIYVENVKLKGSKKTEAKGLLGARVMSSFKRVLGFAEKS